MTSRHLIRLLPRSGENFDRDKAAARQLMTIPGVVVALTYTTVIDDPLRFRRGIVVAGQPA